jgi:hypothetical protein
MIKFEYPYWGTVEAENQLAKYQDQPTKALTHPFFPHLDFKHI